MRRLLLNRWLWTTVILAAINVVGLVKIVSVLDSRHNRLKVESFRPEGTCPPESVVVISFDQPMVGPDLSGPRRIGQMIDIQPSLEGSFVWEDVRTVAFRPHHKLPLGTEYAVTVSKNLTSLLGHSFPKDQVFHFSTPRLELTQVRQSAFNGEGLVTLALEFNDTVWPFSVLEHLSLSTRNGKKIGCRLSTFVASRTVEVQTESTRLDEILLKLTGGLTGSSGPLGIAADGEWVVHIDPALQVSTIEGYCDSWESPCVRVDCNQRVDAKTVRDFIRVEPKVEFTTEVNYDLKLAGGFQPGKRYKFTFLAGLRTQSGAVLAKDLVRTVVMPDCEPDMRFRTQGIYLSALGNLLMPIESVNLKSVKLNIEKIYENNLVHFMQDASGESVDYGGPEGSAPMGRNVAEREFKFPKKQNEVQSVNVDFLELLGPKPGGVYLVSARADDHWRRAQHLVLITDIGITTKVSPTDLVVWVNTLSTAKPITGASVSVFTKTNQKVLSGTTDERGIVHFRNVDRSEDREPFAVVVSKDNDMSFLKLEEGEIDCTSFDAGGRPYLRSGYEAFLYMDRDMFRPGEKAHLRAMVRGPACQLPGEFPIEFDIKRPDGRKFASLIAKLSDLGTAETDVDLPAYALTGRYVIEARLPKAKPSIGTCEFRVEEFVPDRMKAEITAEDRRYRAAEEIAFTVKGTHLFGAPAAGRKIEARCEFIPSVFTRPEWKAYTFTDDRKAFSPVRDSLGEGQLDAKGEKLFKLKVPSDIRPPSALTALLVASVKEVGGRAVTVRLARTVDPYPFYIGLSRDETAAAKVGNDLSFSCVLVKPDGSLAASGELEGTVSKVIWNTVLKSGPGGRYRFESQRDDQQVAKMGIPAAEGRAAIKFKPQESGEFVLRVREPKTGAASSLTFYCEGPGYVPWNMEKPDKIELVCDKKAYLPGDTAHVLMKAPFAGEALFTVEGDRINLVKTLSLQANTAEVDVPIEASFGSNVYCSATVIRKVSAAGQWGTHRAFGVMPVMLDSSSHRLRVEMDAPGQVRPGKQMRVGLHVTDAAGKGVAADVTLAAVDEGVCRLSNFPTPKPWSFFYGKRALEVETSDVYALLMPELEKRKVGTDSSPGGDAPAYDPRFLNPVAAQRVKPVALWQSNVRTAADGVAEVTFNVPQFTGELRLMAVAAGVMDFGHAELPVQVKQPLMVQCSFPRFLAPGDEFSVPATVFNQTGDNGQVQLALKSENGVEALSLTSLSVEVAKDKENTSWFRLRAPTAPGVVSLEVTAGLGAETASEKVEIAVRPTATLQTICGSGSVAAGASTSFTVPGDWMQGTDNYSLSFSAMPGLKLAGGLDYVLRYPYGCVEQTTSSVFPLLYLGDLAAIADPERFAQGEVEPFIQAGIERLLSMQTHGGGFGTWPGDRNPYQWGSVYATHFLVEASNAGHAVPPESLDAALAYLESLLSNWRGKEQSEEIKAYSCYVLALAGKPNKSWAYRLYETRDKLPAYSRFQVAAAMSLAGDTDLLADLVGSAKLPEHNDERDTGELLRSCTREDAILLSAYMDINAQSPNVPLLVQRLESAMQNGRWLTTQENGFALLALGKYCRYLSSQETDYRAEVTVGGKRLDSFTHKDKISLRPESLGGHKVEVSVKGKGHLFYYWSAEGIPTAKDVPEHDSGLTVRRKYLSRDGQPIDLLKIKHGDVLVAELSIQAQRPLQNVVVCDLLPAGLEIENPRIATHETMSRATGEKLTADRTEMRDDRLLLFANLNSDQPCQHRYLVRAVTPGKFRLPPVSASCMYDPAISSVNGAGQMEIRDGQ